MERIEVLTKLQELLADVIDNEELVITEQSSPLNVEDWDSLAHFQFVMEIQSAFSIRFSAAEIQSWKSIGDIITCILSKQ